MRKSVYYFDFNYKNFSGIGEFIKFNKRYL